VTKIERMTKHEAVQEIARSATTAVVASAAEKAIAEGTTQAYDRAIHVAKTSGKTLHVVNVANEDAVKCPKYGEKYNPEEHSVYVCPKCETEGSSACCNPGGNNCLCASCENGEDEE
jgi:hypothetical protein